MNWHRPTKGQETAHLRGGEESDKQRVGVDGERWSQWGRLVVEPEADRPSGVILPSNHTPDGGAFADGKHGFTTGRSRSVQMTDAGEEVRWTGAYVTWWRKGDDGKWKVILDTGAADPPKK